MSIFSFKPIFVQIFSLDSGFSQHQCFRTNNQYRAVWKLGDVTIDNPDGSLRAKFDLSAGPSTPCPAAVQFVAENTTLSGVDFELVGQGYRLSLVKKRVITGK